MTTTTYTVGGAISGLGGSNSVVLKLTGTNPAITQTRGIVANGSYTFTIPLLSGSGWSVSVDTQPTGRTCTVSGGSGSNLGANVVSANVTCT
jgi:hypothetical protein